MIVRELLEYNPNPNDSLKLKCIGEARGLNRQIGDVSINRPGLALAGYFEQFDNQKVHVFGRGETGYLYMLEKSKNYQAINELFKLGVPCSLFTNNLEPPHFFKQLSEQHGCAMLKSPLSSSEILSRFTRMATILNAPSKVIHGVCMEMYGIGVLLLGKSGVGKSESALALIERGHRLIADDVVRLHVENGEKLVGNITKPELAFHMEIRGIGIINIPALFGVASIRHHKIIELVLELVQWNDDENYDRIGLDESSTTILGVKIPKKIIPVRPGRGIPIIIETAAKNERLKQMGYHQAQEFSKILKQYINRSNNRSHTKVQPHD